MPVIAGIWMSRNNNFPRRLLADLAMTAEAPSPNFAQQFDLGYRAQQAHDGDGRP